MDFKISNNAKLVTTILMVVGILFTAIGCFSLGDHPMQRLLANGLINAFFFFAIGLGALFFLALQYATETGWYASVKRVIEAVAGFIPYGIGLMLLVLLTLTFTHGAHIYIWMDPATYTEGSGHYDAIIAGKRPYLNEIFFWIRARLIYNSSYSLQYGICFSKKRDH